MTERMRNILRGFGIAPKSADEIALAAAMREMAEAVELPTVSGIDNGKVLGVSGGKWKETSAVVYVPFTVTMDGDTPVVTTTETFANVKNAVAAGQDVKAEITMPNSSGIALAPVTYKDAATPTVIIFSVAVDLGSDGTAEPNLIQITMASGGVSIAKIELAEASDG